MVPEPCRLSRKMSTTEFTFSSTSALSLLNNQNFINSLDCSLDHLKNESCLHVCGDVRKVFLGWPTFYTCSWYPEVSKALEDPSVNRTTIASLADLGVVGHELELSQEISSSIANCLSDYCNYSSDCRHSDSLNECSLSKLLITNGTTQTLARRNAISCLQHGVCSSKVNVDPDIGGIGVMLSLIMQYSISLSAVAIHAWFFAGSARRRRKINNHTTSMSQTKDAHNLRKEDHRLGHRLEPLTSALVEFQKAQCFFAATLQVAGLIIFANILHDGRDRDALLLRLSSANAYSPIVLTLVHLNLLGGRESWYILSLSSTSFLLGTFTYYLSVFKHLGNYDFYSTRPSLLDSCANFAPIAPCFYENDNYSSTSWGNYGSPQDSYSTGLSVWIISFLILMIQITQKLCRTQRVKDFWKSNPHVLRIRQAYRIFISRPHIPTKLAIWTNFFSAPSRAGIYQTVLQQMKTPQFWLLIQLLAAIAGLLAQLASIIKLLLTSYDLISTKMTFGQIVAVGIWIPVLLEYAYLEYNGAAGGTEYRLKAGLVVVQGRMNRGDGDEEPESDDVVARMVRAATA